MKKLFLLTALALGLIFASAGAGIEAQAKPHGWHKKHGHHYSYGPRRHYGWNRGHHYGWYKHHPRRHDRYWGYGRW